MKYQISANQRHFFDTNHWIEFEELITKTDQEKLLKAIQKHASCKDLCRDIAEVRDVLFAPKFSAIAGLLCQKTPLRYGFDELYCESSHTLAFSCLSNERAVSGLELAMMLCLEGSSEADSEENEHMHIFCKKERNAIFFTPTASCDPKAFLRHRNQTYLLFAWASRDALYLYNQKDPNLHELKKLGYVFGDKVREKTHPILWR